MVTDGFRYIGVLQQLRNVKKIYGRDWASSQFILQMPSYGGNCYPVCFFGWDKWSGFFGQGTGIYKWEVGLGLRFMPQPVSAPEN